jgi:cysteinyl-tRNA synthetase
MDIKLYNTLTNRLETFTPIDPPEVYMYNCGPTVYDYAHIGNFRSFLLADLVRRFLAFAGYQVHQVMNLTDVGHMTDDQLADGGGQDKMELASQRLKQAKKAGQADVDDPNDPYQVARFFIEAFVEDARLMGLRIADEYPANMPRATQNVDRMIDLIRRLIDTGHAYTTEDGAVYFDIQSFPEYGRLSGNTVAAVHAGASGRVQAEHQQGKKHPADFLLWKQDPAHLMKWDSPWGSGYPGWHIECSAMAMGLLGRDTIDIHTGGEDNIFPHHECEIAQSTGATGQPFAGYWLHARHLMVEGQKMSKSKGNFYTVRDLMEKGVEPAVLRYELLRTHYRANANFTFKGVGDSMKAVARLRDVAGPPPADRQDLAATRPMGDSAIEAEFAEALADDLNVSGALGAVNRYLNALEAPTEEDRAALWRIDSVLQVLNPRGRVTQPDQGLTDDQINALCRQIDQARAKKDYATSDALRDQLTEAGIEVRIARRGTTWQRKVVLE